MTLRLPFLTLNPEGLATSCNGGAWSGNQLSGRDTIGVSSYISEKGDTGV